jgi:hypothetical protein
MDPANESRGLKIAVAAFITLAVILMVTAYFLFSAYSAAEARMIAAQYQLRLAEKSQRMALEQYDKVSARIGTRTLEFDSSMQEISAHLEKVEKRLNKLASAVDAAVEAARQNGAQGPELEDARRNVQRAIEAYRSDPNRNYISSLDRLTEAMEYLALVTTRLSNEYVGARKGLGGTSGAAKGHKDSSPGAKD